jgi:hypothetical protein
MCKKQDDTHTKTEKVGSLFFTRHPAAYIPFVRTVYALYPAVCLFRSTSRVLWVSVPTASFVGNWDGEHKRLQLDLVTLTYMNPG